MSETMEMLTVKVMSLVKRKDEAISVSSSIQKATETSATGTAASSSAAEEQTVAVVEKEEELGYST